MYFVPLRTTETRTIIDKSNEGFFEGHKYKNIETSRHNEMNSINIVHHLLNVGQNLQQSKSD
jgi:hypothetical protein